MTSIGNAAVDYEPEKAKTIAELEAVSVKQEIHKTDKVDTAGKKYSYSYILQEGEEYRVPNSVLNQLQMILAEKPETKTFKVAKNGEGINTSYQVIVLE